MVAHELHEAKPEARFRGPTPLRVALEQSLNAVTVRVASMIGMEPIAETVERFGIMDHMPREYSMALGAGETTLLRHTAAYAMLVNGGKRITPTFIDRIQDRNGATIFRADQRPCQRLRRCRLAAISRCRSSRIRASRWPIPARPSRS